MEEEESDETYNLRNKNNKKERIVIKNPFTPQFKKLNMKL